MDELVNTFLLLFVTLLSVLSVVKSFDVEIRVISANEETALFVESDSKIKFADLANLYDS